MEFPLEWPYWPKIHFTYNKNKNSCIQTRRMFKTKKMPLQWRKVCFSSSYVPIIVFFTVLCTTTFSPLMTRSSLINIHCLQEMLSSLV